MATTVMTATDWGSRYANVDVGNMIECANCCRKQFRSRYSNNQLSKFQESTYKARRGGQPAELPRCRDCTAGNTIELKCAGCYVIKGLEFFSKQQRKNPDNAKCIPCQQAIEDLVPDLRAANEEERIKEASQNRRANPFPGMSNIGSTLPSMNDSLPGSGNRSQAPSGGSGEVMIVQDRTSAWGGESVTTSSIVSGYHPRSTSGESQYSTPLTGSTTATTRGGFHKQGAYKASAYDRAMTQLQREDLLRQEAQAARTRDDDDDEDDGEWEL
ncbi:Stc1 domain-containing protein [Exophiala viscosa]|uniref:Stc1 domain-containing protein n=1 Tax=Exophiala viscosa TaxID=2486360 RepID=UPI002193C505|nr:Stc1 domain-containing protein [Exophiala viscosa]